MNKALEMMLRRYDCRSRADYENALKEIFQEITLLALWRGKFFENAAFYGGTALRILYGLDRFSEDLDFSLLKPNPRFKLSPFLSAIQTELNSFGLTVEIEEKEKSTESAIKSAFLKSGTKTNLVKISVPESITKHIQKNELLKIKFEIDLDPPPFFETEAKFLLQPIPFSVLTFKLPDLFAGKLHAVLYRKWKDRVKGRDFYDLIWYLGHKTPVRIKHLEARLVQSGDWPKNKNLTLDDVKLLLQKKFEEVDWRKAKADILPFIKDSASLNLWTKEFFSEIIKNLTVYR